MLSANVAFGPMAVVTHWKNTTTAEVPSVMWVPLLKVGPKPLAAAKAQIKRVRPKIGMTFVFAMNR